MLIEKATRFFILDVCFDVFFKSISENLKTISSDDIPKINDLYKKISAKNGTETFYNCRILDVFPFEEDGYSTIMVEFDYDEYAFTTYGDGEVDDDEDLLEPSESATSAESILKDAEHEGAQDDDPIPDDDELDDLGIDCVDFKDFLFIP